LDGAADVSAKCIGGLGLFMSRFRRLGVPALFLVRLKVQLSRGDVPSSFFFFSCDAALGRNDFDSFRFQKGKPFPR